jgi:hypothetical protein
LTANGVAGDGATVTWWTGAGGTGTNLGTGLTLANAVPGTYFARVTGTCTPAVEASITVNSLALPAITNVTAGANPICANTTTTLTANGVAGDGATVTWWTGAGGTGTNLGTGLTLANAVPGTYFARVTGTCTPAVEASITVNSLALPAITNVTAGANPICANVTTTLTANGVAGDGATVTWWTGADGTGTNLGTGLTLANAVPGTYFARVTGTCTPAVEASITINSLALPAISNVTAGANPICANTTTTLTANGVAGDGATITWWSGAGGTGTNLGTGSTLANAVPGTYYARVTGTCTPAVEASITVNSLALPAITNVTAAANPICANATTTLTANGVAGDGATVTWWTGAGGIGTNLGTGLTLANAVPGTYFARVTGTCTPAVEASITVNSLALPAITDVTAAANPICANTTTTLTANGVAGDGATVTWWTGAGGTGTNLGTGSTLANAVPGTYYARVTGTCTPAVEASITVNSLALPAITNVTAAANPICANTTTTLTANGVAGDGATVTWWTGAGGTGTNLGTGSTLANAVPGTYYARVTGTCTPAVEASITVNSLALPAITNVTAAANPICANTTTTLTANGVAGDGATVTWWTGAGGTGTNLGTGSTLTNAVPGTYYARVTGTCTPAVEASITVNSLALPAISNVTAGANPICANTTTTLTANGVAGDGATVTWWTGAGGTGTNLGTGLTLANAVPGTYFARVTGTCTPAVEASITVNSLALPAITNVTAGANPICANVTTTLTANGVAGDGATVTWWTGADGTGTNLGTGLTLANAVPGTYFARVTGTCTPAVEASITINSLALPAISNVTAGANPICANTTTTLTANGVAGDGATVTWWTGAGGTGTNLGTGLTLANAVPGTYFARVTGTCTPAVEASITVNSLALPAITNVTAGANPICANVTTTLTANGVAGDGATITWWSGAGGTGTNLGTGSTLANAVPGTYYARVTGTCTPAVEANITVIGDPLPIALAGGSTTICVNASYTLLTGEASASYGTIAWTENGAGSITAGATTLTPTYTAAAGDAGNAVTLTMTVTSNNACGIQTATAIYTINVYNNFTAGAIATTGETICYGGTPATTIGSTTAASGGNEVITYEWRSSADSYATAISGATAATYLPPAGLTATTSYQRYAKDGVCNTTMTQSTGTWTVTVYNNFTAGTIATTGETICYGGTPATTIGSTTAASGGNEVITYEWRSSADSYANAISGATAATYLPPAGLTATTSYQRYAKDGVCNTTMTQSTGTWTVTVYNNFTAGAIATTGETICYGGTPATTIGSTTAASGGNEVITYEWRSSADGYTNAISGATAATYLPPAGLTTTTSYQRYAKDGVCNTTMTQSTGTWTVTVYNNFTAGAIATTGETICYGGTPATTIGSTTAASGGNEVITYEWRSSADGYTNAISGATAATYLPPAGLTTTTSYQRYAKDGVCNTTMTQSTGTWTVTVYNNFTAGAIATTGETICYGGTPATTIGSTTAASGGNEVITYEWRSSADSYATAISGATAATYLPPAGLTATTSYQRYAKDGVCNTTMTQSTGTWTVTVYNNFTAGAIATTGETICYGGTPATTIGSTTAASGGNEVITYEWRSSADGYTNAISGATAATYLPPAGLTTTTSYQRYAKDGVCNTTMTQSTTWTVTVYNNFTAGAIATTGETICYGGTPATTIGSTTAASGGNEVITYEWRSSADSYATAISGATAATYLPPAGLTATTSYQRYAKDGVCNTTMTQSTGTWTVTVYNNFTAGAIATTGETICYGGTPATTIGSTTAASGGNEVITYEWRSSADGYTNAISGATAATYLPPAGLTTTTSYQRYAKDGVCNTTMTQSTGTWTVTVYNNFTAGAIATTGETICYGGTPATTIGSTTAASGGNEVITYEWRSSADSYATAISGATAATYLPPAGLTATTSYQRYAKDGVCNTTMTQSTGTWTVTVYNNFTAGAIATTGETICYGGTPATTIGSTTAASGGNEVITYEWRSSADSYATAISGATAATYLPPAGLTATTSYQRYAKDGVCNTTMTQSTGTWTVTVYNQLVAGTAGSDQTLCYGATPAQLSANAPTGGSGSFAYQWQVYNGSTWDDISGQTGLTYQPGALTATTKYRLEQTDTYCGSNPTTVVNTNEVTITIYNQLVAGTAGSDQTLCYGATPAQLSTGGSGIRLPVAGL